MARLGRPRDDNARRKALNIRMTEGEYATVAEAATAAGVTASEYVRAKALAAAKRAAK